MACGGNSVYSIFSFHEYGFEPRYLNLTENKELRFLLQTTPKTADYVILQQYTTTGCEWPNVTKPTPGVKYILRYVGNLSEGKYTDVDAKYLFFRYEHNGGDYEFILIDRDELKKDRRTFLTPSISESIGPNFFEGKLESYVGSSTKPERAVSGTFFFTTPWILLDAQITVLISGQPNWYLDTTNILTVKTDNNCSKCKNDEYCGVIEGGIECIPKNLCGQCGFGNRCVVNVDGTFNCEFLPTEEENQKVKTHKILIIIFSIIVLFLLIMLIYYLTKINKY